MRAAILRWARWASWPVSRQRDDPAAKVTADQVRELRAGGAPSHLVGLARWALAIVLVLVLAIVVLLVRRRRRPAKPTRA